MDKYICDDKSWETEFPDEYDKIKNMTEEEFMQYFEQSKEEETKKRGRKE